MIGLPFLFVMVELYRADELIWSYGIRASFLSLSLSFGGFGFLSLLVFLLGLDFFLIIIVIILIVVSFALLSLAGRLLDLGCFGWGSFLGSLLRHNTSEEAGQHKQDSHDLVEKTHFKQSIIRPGFFPRLNSDPTRRRFSPLNFPILFPYALSFLA